MTQFKSHCIKATGLTFEQMWFKLVDPSLNDSKKIEAFVQLSFIHSIIVLGITLIHIFSSELWVVSQALLLLLIILSFDNHIQLVFSSFSLTNWAKYLEYLSDI